MLGHKACFKRRAEAKGEKLTEINDQRRFR
jgi:hypothetical protein